MIFFFIGKLNAQEKALYVDGLKNIIGDYYKEKELLQFAQDSGYTYLMFYNIHYIHKNIFDITDPATSTPLRDFLVKAKTEYGVLKAGVAGETFSPFLVFHDYNMDHISDPNARFDIYNMEFEYWHPVSTGVGGYYCDTYLDPNGFPCDTAGAFDFILPELRQMDSLTNLYSWLNSEIYIGNPNEYQCAEMAERVDRVLVHYYRTSDVYANGNSIYNYKSYRLPALTDSVTSIRVMPIFHGGDDFMGTWLETHPEAQAFDTWMNGQNGYVADNGPWKSKVTIDGYIWFKYTAMHDTARSPKPSLTGRLAFHNYTSYAAGDGELFIYDFHENSLTNISSSWPIDNEINPQFSPDGSKLVFMGFNEGTDDWDVFLWTVGSASNPENLTNARNNRDEDPKFSPDGSKIIYKERYWDGEFKYRFQEMDLAGVIQNTIEPFRRWILQA